MRFHPTQSAAALLLLALPAPTLPRSEPHPWVARVSALGTSGTQLHGMVRLTPTDKPNEYKVTADLRGAKVGNQIPWSISTGQCGEASATEVGERVAYRMFVAAADGMARVNSTQVLPLSDDNSYHVNFYAGPTDREHVVSCGALVGA